MTTGRNILWRTPLPNWGHASPLVVRDRAVVMSEPGWKHDWPVLTCIDTVGGKVFWQREINHLPVTGLTPGQQADAARQVAEFHATWRRLYTVFGETAALGDGDAARDRFKELGYETKFSGKNWKPGGGYGQLRGLSPKPQLRLPHAGLRQDVWRHDCGLGYDEIGAAFATPVSDGKHLYVVASRSAAASYDFEGNLRWMTFLPFPPELGKYIETNGRSPILYRDLMLTDYPGYTVAIEKATGRIRWQVKTFGGGIATPVIVTVTDPASGDNVDVLVTEGYQGKGMGIHAIRLPDGKALRLAAAKPGKGGAPNRDGLANASDSGAESVLPPLSQSRTGGWGPGGNSMMVNTDHCNVAYFSGGCHISFRGRTVESPDQPLWTKLPAAVRFAFGADRDALEVEVLWDGGSFQGKPPANIPMVYHGGKLFLGDAVLDALSGRVLAGGRGGGGAPPTRHLLLLALGGAGAGTGRFYGLEGPSGMADGPPPADKPVAHLVCGSLDGRLLGRSPLAMAPPDGEKSAQTRSQVGWERWGFGYGMPFTIGGDRLYLRSSDELVCVGNR